MFDGEDLRLFIEQATWVAVNDYEGQMLQERTGWDEAAIGEQVEALIVTRGAEGSRIFSNGDVIDIPVVKAAAIKDPTGCGDAYRAGLLFGIMNGLSWPDTGRLAALLGSCKIESQGTQNHRFSFDSIAAAFSENFGSALEVNA